MFGVGSQHVAGMGALAKQRLPTDPIGVFTLTLLNVAVGSAVRVEDQSTGASRWIGTAATSTVTIPLDAYVNGNPLNNLRIKVRKASSAPFYIPFETQTTAFVGTASIFVSQIPDE